MRSIVPLPSIVSGTEWVWVSILTSTNLCDKERWLSQNHRKMKTVPCSFPSPIFTTASPISLSTPLPTRLFWSSFSLRMISSSCHCFRLLVFNDDPTVQGVEFWWWGCSRKEVWGTGTAVEMRFQSRDRVTCHVKSLKMLYKEIVGNVLVNRTT